MTEIRGWNLGKFGNNTEPKHVRTFTTRGGGSIVITFFGENCVRANQKRGTEIQAKSRQC